ncbi:hypothetical protein [Microlunatus sp. Gsoil 973]|uniref:PIN-like domain-containing protein n=1 Tax=Microlunatus sp. Gsoil 973 TaxID=2672569 RepID=UPI00351B43CE
MKKRFRPPCPITAPSALDSVWIPIAASHGWLIVTRDRAIQDHRAEINAVRDHRAKMVNLAGLEATNTWAQLEIFMTRWRDIDHLAEQSGPFIYVATRTGKFRAVDLT